MRNDIDAMARVPVAGRLAGKVALVSGAGGGQGQAVALMFARAGARVVASDISPEGVAATAALASSDGLAVDISRVDVADPAATEAWIEASAAHHGRIDVLYNNAAQTQFAPFGEMTLEQWRETLRLELDIVFTPTRLVWRHMMANGGGSIINIASVSGMRGTEFIGAAAHAAGKSGVIGFTRQLALEGAPHWIRANTISPGPIVTPVTSEFLEVTPEFQKRFNGWPLLARTGRSIDIAFAGLYLASDESSFVTGANLVVDGGWSSKGGYTEH